MSSKLMTDLSPCRDSGPYVPLNHVLVFPANLVTQSADRAVLPPRLQSQYPKSLRHDHALLLVVGWRYTFEDLETLHGSGTTSSLMRDHATDGLVEDARRGAKVEWS